MSKGMPASRAASWLFAKVRSRDESSMMRMSTSYSPLRLAGIRRITSDIVLSSWYATMKINTRFLGEEGTSLLINNNVSILVRLPDQGYLIYGRAIPASQPQGVSHQFQAGLITRGEDRFRMKLHSLNRQLTVANSHNDRGFAATRGTGRDFQTSRKLLWDRIQRVVAAHLNLPGQSLKNTLPLVDNFRWLSVNRVRHPTKCASKRLHNPLQAQANAKYRDSFLRRMPHQTGNAEIGRPAATRRNQNQVRIHAIQNLERYPGAIGHHLGARLPRVIGERVDEAIVVIDEQQTTLRRFGNSRSRRRLFLLPE